MTKGYLTVFLALSLSFLAGFILFLTEFAIRKSERNRLECVADVSMNSVLAEYQAELHKKYDLLYVDTSYLGMSPGIENLYNRLDYYLRENTDALRYEKQSPWGIPHIVCSEVTSFETATAGHGASMRNQAIHYISATGITHGETRAAAQVSEAECLDQQDVMSDWDALMGELSGMELPQILNKDGLPEEVPLSNPADWVYALAGSDKLFLAGINPDKISPVKVTLDTLCSHRVNSNTCENEKVYLTDNVLYLNYLYEKMGYFFQPQNTNLLTCQLEYLAEGQETDLQNIKGIAERIFRWRFADNAAAALSDSGLRAQAEAAATELQAVQLDERFKGPVTESILYACAYLESIGDIRAIYEQSGIPLRKTKHKAAVSAVINGSLASSEPEGEFTYSYYLACMLLLEEEGLLNYRAMDIMEMEIRAAGSSNFRMDWCVENFKVKLKANGAYGEEYSLSRRYGFY